MPFNPAAMLPEVTAAIDVKLTAGRRPLGRELGSKVLKLAEKGKSTTLSLRA
jgi:hypothetical protein